MRILKSHPLLKLVNSYIIDSPQPSNISYLWNFGSLLALCLVIQIITGVTLAMHYNPSVLEAFNSVEHIMRDVNNGWLIRYLHSNTASAFFFLVYLHIGRGLYYGSYRAPRTLVWIIGTVIFILMMATAFLGYQHSPKWFLLNLYSSLNILLSNNIYSYYISYLSSFLFFIVFTLFYLDNFKLSSVYSIKCFQIFSIIVLLFTLIIIIHNSINITSLIYQVNDNNDVSIHGHVNFDKEAGRAIGQGLNVIGSQIGLGTTITGISLAVAKGISKASMPPLQKAGIILSTGLIAGLGHSRISVINRNSILRENIENNTHINNNINNISSSINKLVDDTTSSSPLQDLLLNTEFLNYTCISLTLILMVQIIFKLHLKDNTNLNLSNILGYKINNKLEYYLNKVIALNKKMSVIYIWIILVLLVLGLSFSALNCSELYTNIDSYILVHNNINNK
jgi:hypothetical protein